MDLHYTLTLEDYLEAQRAHSQPEPAAEKAAGWASVLFWVGAVVLIVAGLVALSRVDRRLQEEAARAGLERPSLVVAAVTSLIPMGLVVAAVQLIFRRALRPSDAKSLVNLLAVLAMVMAANSVISTWLQGPEPPKPPPKEVGLLKGVLLPLAPWLVMFGVVWLAVFSFLRKVVRRTWDGQQHLHRAERVTVSERGLVMEQDRIRSEYRWDAFLKYRESEGLFLLYIGDLAFHMVPKRAFVDGAQVDAFRGMVHWHIANRPAASQGPEATPPPLPEGGT